MADKALSTTSSSFTFYRSGRVPKYVKYEAMRDAFYEASAAANDPQLKKYNESLGRVANAGFAAKNGGPALVLRDADAASIQPIPLMTTMSVMYGNPEFIGPEIMPMAPSDQENAQYLEYMRSSMLDVSRKGMGGGTRSSGTEGLGFAYKKRSIVLESDSSLEVVGADLVYSTDTPVNAMQDMRELADYDFSFKRELRIRDLVTNPANYNSSNKLALANGSKWDDAGGTPDLDILNAKTKVWRGKGGSTLLMAAMSIDVWTVLRNSPRLKSLLSADYTGFISPQIFCEIFELDGICVSESYINTNNIALSASYGRVWGKHFALIRVAKNPQTKTAAFGYNFRWVPAPLKGSMGFQNTIVFDMDEGDFGSFKYKTAAKEAAVITAKDAGFLFPSCIH
jgi:hypothetical protein